MSKPLNVALIGSKFMGRAHSNGWRQVGRFFDVPREPVLHTIAARDPKDLAAFAKRWGWANTTTRWQEIAEVDEVDVVVF